MEMHQNLEKRGYVPPPPPPKPTSEGMKGYVPTPPPRVPTVPVEPMRPPITPGYTPPPPPPSTTIPKKT
jgi:hypothetical protein